MKYMVLMMIIPGVLLAQLPEAPPENSQFHFLVGEWDVLFKNYDPEFGKLEKASKALIQTKYLNEKRMFFEEWRSFDASGNLSNHGVTLRSWSPEESRWRAVYFSTFQKGIATDMIFDKEGDEMVGRGQVEHPVHGKVLFRLRFFNITEGGFNWESKVSIDYGKTWHLESEYTAKRRAS